MKPVVVEPHAEQKYNALMRPRLRTLLVPRRFARLRFTFYEAAGLLIIAGMCMSRR